MKFPLKLKNANNESIMQHQTFLEGNVRCNLEERLFQTHVHMNLNIKYTKSS
jgi:hypothetical protein